MKKLLQFIALLCLLAIRASGAYTVTTHSSYIPSGSTTQLAVGSTAGNSNVVGVAFCPNSGCTTGTCPTTTSFTDNAGSVGGSGNNTYTVDQNSASSQILCADIGSSFNVVSTSSGLTATATVGGSPFYNVAFSLEVNGLGASPSVESSGTSSGSGLTSVATGGSCTSGDFAVSFWYSNAQPSAGSGWTAIGTPGSNQIMEWQTVSGTGVVTATVTGTGSQAGASVVCYKPTGSSTNFPRTVSDGTLSEALVRLFGAKRTEADGTASETTGRLVVYGRVGADGTLSESTGRLYASLRVSSDTPFSSEATSRSGVFGRVGTDGTLSEALAGFRSLPRGVSDGTLSESIGRLSAFLRPGTDGTLSESIARLRDVPRPITDGSLSESPGRGIVFLRVGTDGTLTEVPSRLYASLRGNADGSLSESTSRSGVFSRSPADTGFLSVVVFHGRALSVGISTIAFSTEAVIRSGVFGRSAADGSLSEGLGRKVAFLRTDSGSFVVIPSIAGVVGHGGSQHLFVVISDSTALRENAGQMWIPSSRMAIYLINREGQYLGVIRDGIYIRPATAAVVTK